MQWEQHAGKLANRIGQLEKELAAARESARSAHHSHECALALARDEFLRRQAAEKELAAMKNELMLMKKFL